ncbi:MAG: hypothetical protein ABH876_01480 [Patescibacteria group bacterium]|nr:hypothetical protein [Patescibacteria group bacterium]MBU1876774.1 hypothetical protein [Patescibacteria group bacterium]
MKKTFIFFIVLLVVLTGAWFGLRFLIGGEEPIACTQDAKLCPDGSYVGRTGPDCEFAECSLGNNELSSNFGNNQIEKAIINYLLTQKHFSWKTRDNSHNFCAVENLKPENELFPLYVWASCKEYIIQDGKLKILSGASVPVKIDYPNELSFYDLSKFSYEVPGDGSHYAEDIRRIFPEDIWQHIFDFNRKNIIKRIESIAFANISSWELIKQAITNCEVESVWQTHDRTVGAKLKNGEELVAVEPKIDDIINIAEAFESKCGKILMGTE